MSRNLPLRRLTVSLVALAATALIPLTAGPASAKSMSVVGATCVGGASGNGTFADMGSGRFNVGFQTAQYGQWRVQIFMDGGSAPYSQYLAPAPSNGLNLTFSLNPPKGKHRFQILATNLTAGGQCTAFAGSGV